MRAHGEDGLSLAARVHRNLVAQLLVVAKEHVGNVSRAEFGNLDALKSKVANTLALGEMVANAPNQYFHRAQGFTDPSSVRVQRGEERISHHRRRNELWIVPVAQVFDGLNEDLTGGPRQLHPCNPVTPNGHQLRVP